MTALVTEELRRASVSIPPLSASCEALLRLVSHGDADAHHVTSVVERDERVTLELLRLANSAYFAQRARVTTVRAAVVLLGTRDALRAAIAAAMTGLFGARPGVLGDAEIVDACLAFAQGWRLHGVEAEATAGLLMPLGSLVLQQYRPQAFADFAGRVAETADWADLHALERQRFGVTRCDALRVAVEVWKLPMTLAEVLDTWHVCAGAATPQWIATVTTAHTLASPYFREVALR